MDTNTLNYKISLSVMIVTWIKQYLSNKVLFMKKLSNTQAELKKSVAYKKPPSCSKKFIETLSILFIISN